MAVPTDFCASFNPEMLERPAVTVKVTEPNPPAPAVTLWVPGACTTTVLLLRPSEPVTVVADASVPVEGVTHDTLTPGAGWPAASSSSTTSVAGEPLATWAPSPETFSMEPADGMMVVVVEVMIVVDVVVEAVTVELVVVVGNSWVVVEVDVVEVDVVVLGNCWAWAVPNSIPNAHTTGIRPDCKQMFFIISLLHRTRDEPHGPRSVGTARLQGRLTDPPAYIPLHVTVAYRIGSAGSGFSGHERQPPGRRRSGW
jgi:hypothetical protein